MNFKNIVWFIKAISYFVLLRSLAIIIIIIIIIIAVVVVVVVVVIISIILPHRITYKQNRKDNKQLINIKSKMNMQLGRSDCGGEISEKLKAYEKQRFPPTGNLR